MKKQSIKVFLILGLMAVAGISTLEPAIAKPVIALKPPVVSDYEYGFQEGVTYSKRNDYAGYIHMLTNYRNALAMYPENAAFYNARISGLMAGWGSHGVPPWEP